jgi:hypothetical protein
MHFDIITIAISLFNPDQIPFPVKYRCLIVTKHALAISASKVPLFSAWLGEESKVETYLVFETGTSDCLLETQDTTAPQLLL